ncbi:MAG: tetratricopeptide repeat protein [Pseudomonadota bacterium]
MAIGTRKKLLVAALAAALLAGCGGAEERKAKYLERGKAYIAEENWDKARVEIKNVLQIDPKAAEAYYLLGQVEEKRQEWAKAFGSYAKAVELDPDLVDARSRLAQFYMLQANAFKAQDERDGEAKALGQAQAEIDEILKRDPKHSGARALQASMLLREGKSDEALALAEAVVKEDPGHGPAAGLLASLYEQAGRVADAEKVLVAAVGTVDEPIPLKMHLAQLYAREKKNDAAEAVLRELISARPEELSYRAQLAQFLVQTGQIDKAEAVLRDAVEADPNEARRYLMLADLLVKKEDTGAAAEYLRQSIARKPELSDLRLGLAQLYEHDKKLEDAQQVYADMIAHYGDEPAGLQARNRLATHAAAAGDMDRARKLVEEVLAKNPKDGDALVMKGRMDMENKDYDAAVASFRTVLKDQPDSVPVLHLLAEAQLRKGDTELAGDNLRRAVEVAPQNVSARVKYARFLIARKELVRALEQIDYVLERDPANVEAVTAKSELLAAKGDLAAVKEQLARLKEAAPDSTDASLRLARVHLAEGDAAAALAEVDSVLARDAKNVQALVLKTDILAATKDVDALGSAISDLKAAAPDFAEGYFRMGRYLRAKGDIAGALKEYERGYALAKDVGKVAMLSEIINTQIAAGQADPALARLQAILREEPDHKVAHDLLGVVQMARKDYVAAEAAFNRQIQINPNSGTVYGQLAAARERQGNAAGAVAAYEQGLAVLKDDVGLQVGLASLHERQGNFEAAIALYENVLKTQPDNAISVNNLAALLADHRDDAQSLARAKELVARLEPVQRAPIQDTVGWVYYRAGDYAKAVEVLEGVVSSAPDVGIFQYHLGMAYAKAGDKSKARNALSAALELGDFPGADEARRTLEGL